LKHLLLILLSFLTISLPAEAGLENSTVKIIASKRPIDIGRPWQFDGLSQHNHLGVVVEGGMVLTTAYAADSATNFEIQLFGDTRKYPAQIFFVDFEANLALIKPLNPSLLKDKTPVSLGTDLSVGDKVDIYRPRDAYQLTGMPGHLSEVGTFAAVTSSYTMAAYLFKVQQNGLGWTEPVMRGQKLVALTTGQDSNFVHAIPVSMIRHFLNDQHDESYRGFPNIGIGLSPLVNPAARKHYKAEGFRGGVRLSKVAEGSGFAGSLKENDVLLELEGHELSEHGYYQHPNWGKVHLKYIVNQAYAGDELTLKVLRDGKVLTVKEKVERHNSSHFNIPHNRYGKPEPHIIFGGLIIQELTRDYLEQWGNNWRNLAPFDLLYTANFLNDATKDKSQRFIVLGSVLADEFNRGYEKISHAIITEVNDQPVENLEQVKAALADHAVARHGKLYARIQLARDGGEVILDYSGLAQTHARIAKTYNITKLGSFYGSNLSPKGTP
jgi:S1-C subfamily serine protease